MEQLLARPCADAKVTCVVNVLKNANAIKDTASKDLMNKSEKHFSWLEEILAEIQTTLTRLLDASYARHLVICVVKSKRAHSNPCIDIFMEAFHQIFVNVSML